VIAALCRFHRKSMPHPRHPQFQALDADSKRLVMNLAPLLRIADALDRGNEQKVRNVTTAAKNGAVSLLVQAERDADLEIWTANEALKSVGEVYTMPIVLKRARPQRLEKAQH
jgi:exopolyphosphatase / guanosine-5'-triphosphate,3'-diphosphate pyrophosphatase